MYLITFHAKVNPKSNESERFEDCGGAYVSCYINFKDYEASEKLAKIFIKESGWIPKAKLDAWIIRRKDCKTKKDLQYYSEAIKYGHTLVFHMYPKDAEDADIDLEAKEKRADRKSRTKT
jgi:hypothetical protein